MNNKTANMIRDFAFARILDGINECEMIQIDTNKYIIPVDIENETYFCELDLVAKKEDYTPESDIEKYFTKVENAKKRLEKTQKEREKYNME